MSFPLKDFQDTPQHHGGTEVIRRGGTGVTTHRGLKSFGGRVLRCASALAEIKSPNGAESGAMGVGI